MLAMRRRVTLGDEGVTSGDDSDGANQILGLCVFDEEPACPGAERFEYVLVGFKSGEDKDAESREIRVGSDAPGSFESIDSRHSNVHEDDVGRGAPSEVDRGLAVRRFPHNFNVFG